MTDPLPTLRAAGALGHLDVAFADLMLRLDAHGGSPELALAAALASRRVADGHVCLVLDEHAGQPLGDGDGGRPRAPALAAWTAALRQSSVVGEPGGARRPLVLDAAGRLYLWRYWDYERRLGAGLRARAAYQPLVDRGRLAVDLRAFFPPAAPGDPDWQRVAAAAAVLRGLCVISGGPGTGKTTTVAAVIGLLASQAAARGERLRIGLAAPTGKAAARMDESLRASAVRDQLTPAALAMWPEGAATLHRLLGARPDSVQFRHDAANPLPLDVLVVDEASMVDLALMAKLVDALPPRARLVLLGDRDQLASVEAGAVLADLCGPAPGCSADFAAALARCGAGTVPAADASSSALGNAVVLLRRSFRFGPASGIGRLAGAVNRGDAGAAIGLLRDGLHADLGWAEPASAADLQARLADMAASGFADYAAAAARGDVAAAFEAFRRFRVLCAHRHGPAGVEAVGRRLEEALGARGLLRPDAEWYAGRPVMVTRNDYGQRLFNGDVGLALPDAGGELRVWFEAVHGGLRPLAPPRLPEHETVWAMTVHKSQGSEFDEVLLVLPPEPSRVTTRELLYTAVTRARHRVTVWGSPAVLSAAVATRVRRSSGLRDALWSPG